MARASAAAVLPVHGQVLAPAKLLGRVFCNYAQDLEYMVWTQNDGRLMGYVAGPVHTNVWDWWVAVHHNIGIGGAP